MVWGEWIVLLIVVTLAVLYRQGYITLNSKRALLFSGSIGGKKATFTSCTGRIQRIFRPKEEKKYRFSLKLTLSSGAVSVYVLGSRKEPVLVLTPESPWGEVWLEKGKLYTLRIHFDHATGSYELSWE